MSITVDKDFNGPYLAIVTHSELRVNRNVRTMTAGIVRDWTNATGNENESEFIESSRKHKE